MCTLPKWRVSRARRARGVGNTKVQHTRALGEHHRGYYAPRAETPALASALHTPCAGSCVCRLVAWGLCQRGRSQMWSTVELIRSRLPFFSIVTRFECAMRTNFTHGARVMGVANRRALFTSLLFFSHNDGERVRFCCAASRANEQAEDGHSAKYWKRNGWCPQPLHIFFPARNQLHPITRAPIQRKGRLWQDDAMTNDAGQKRRMRTECIRLSPCLFFTSAWKLYRTCFVIVAWYRHVSLIASRVRRHAQFAWRCGLPLGLHDTTSVPHVQAVAFWVSHLLRAREDAGSSRSMRGRASREMLRWGTYMSAPVLWKMQLDVSITFSTCAPTHTPKAQQWHLRGTTVASVDGTVGIMEWLGPILNVVNGVQFRSVYLATMRRRRRRRGRRRGRRRRCFVVMLCMQSTAFFSSFSVAWAVNVTFQRPANYWIQRRSPQPSQIKSESAVRHRCMCLLFTSWHSSSTSNTNSHPFSHYFSRFHKFLLPRGNHPITFVHCCKVFVILLKTNN